MISVQSLTQAIGDSTNIKPEKKLTIASGIRLSASTKKRLAPSKTRPANDDAASSADTANAFPQRADSPTDTANLASGRAAATKSSTGSVSEHVDVNENQAGASEEKKAKDFTFWAKMDVDYVPTIKSKRGGQKAKKQKDREKEKLKATRYTGPANYDEKYSINRPNVMKDFSETTIYDENRAQWKNDLHAFDRDVALPAAAPKRKKVVHDMFAPPPELDAVMFNNRDDDDDDEDEDDDGQGADINPNEFMGDTEMVSNNRPDFATRYMTGRGWQTGQGLGAEGNDGIKTALWAAKGKRGIGVIRGGKRA